MQTEVSKTKPMNENGRAASEVKPAKKSWWRSKRAKMSGKITLGATIAGIIVWWFWFHPYVSTDDARVAETLVRVAPQGVTETVEKLNVDEGTRVKKGDVLIELDHRNAEAQLERAKARAVLAESDLKRTALLASQSGISKRDLDRAQSDAQTAEAEMKLAQLHYDNTFLKSPVDGIVVQKSTEAGDILEAGQTAVTVADVDGAWVSANIEETSIGDVKIGQNVKISVDEGGELTGKVSEITTAVASQFALIPSENAAGNFTKLVQRVPIKIALDPHPNQVLRAGESVEIKIRVR